MLAFAGVWIGLLSFVTALTMLVYRPAFTDLTVTSVLYFTAPGAMCLGGLVLWAYRKEPRGADPGVDAQRVQAKVAIGLAILSAAIVYTLIIRSEKIEPIEPPAGRTYNPSS